jgi:hypothetical protein
MEYIRRAWKWLTALITAMDYTADDYIFDRIRGLEHEVRQLKDEKSRTERDDARRG